MWIVKKNHSKGAETRKAGAKAPAFCKKLFLTSIAID